MLGYDVGRDGGNVLGCDDDSVLGCDGGVICDGGGALGYDSGDFLFDCGGNDFLGRLLADGDACPRKYHRRRGGRPTSAGAASVVPWMNFHELPLILVLPVGRSGSAPD